MKTSIRFLCFVAFLGAWAALAQPMPPSVEVSVRPEKVKVGEPFEYRVVLSHTLGHRFELLTPESTDPFVYLSSQRQREDVDTRSKTTFVLKWALFQLGPHSLPVLNFQFTHADGKGVWQLPGAQVEGVAVTKEDETQLFDIREPESVMIPSWKWLYWGLGLLAFLLLLIAVLTWVQRRLQRRKSVVKPLSLYEHTRQALEALAQEGLHERGQVREFYFRLSEILRGYLGKRLGFEALECTTPELLEALRARPLTGLSLDKMATFANLADMARYAKSPVDYKDCQASLDMAFQLLKDTTPVEGPV